MSTTTAAAATNATNTTIVAEFARECGRIAARAIIDRDEGAPQAPTCPLSEASWRDHAADEAAAQCQLTEEEETSFVDAYCAGAAAAWAAGLPADKEAEDAEPPEGLGWVESCGLVGLRDPLGGVWWPDEDTSNNGEALSAYPNGGKWHT